MIGGARAAPKMLFGGKFKIRFCSGGVDVPPRRFRDRNSLLAALRFHDAFRLTGQHHFLKTGRRARLPDPVKGSLRGAGIGVSGAEGPRVNGQDQSSAGSKAGAGHILRSEKILRAPPAAPPSRFTARAIADPL